MRKYSKLSLVIVSIAVAVLSAGVAFLAILQDKEPILINAVSNFDEIIADTTVSSYETEFISPDIAPQFQAVEIMPVSDDIKQQLDVVFSSQGTVNASVAVIADGQVAYHYEYGWADKSIGLRTTQSSKFRSASVSKVIDTMLAMKLYDDKKLDLKADLSDYFGYPIQNRHSPGAGR